MLDHVLVRVTDFRASLAFYDAVLAPLGFKRVMELEESDGRFCGYGADMPRFWISEGGGQPFKAHVAFAAKDRATVDAFHEAALKHGAESNGVPGIREHYHPNYYAAFVLDPNGNNIEAVCHAPVEERRGAVKRTAAKAKKGTARTGKAAKAGTAKRPATRRR